jgi:D-serine deaminase-like pyridoxal phosphate-dependent protein
MDLMHCAGISSLLTTPVASKNKTDFVAALVKQGGDIRAVVDHSDQVSLYQKSAAEAGCTLKLLVDLDVGDHRTGVPCDERAIALAQQVAAGANLRFAGLQAYSVSASHTDGRDTRRKHSESAIARAIPIQRELMRLGFDAGVLTGGSTGTWDIDTKIPELTEIQAGSYPLMDVAYTQIGGVPFEPAMTVLATVVSANHPDRVTVDAGFKAFATDRPFGPQALGVAAAEWRWGGDEHGILQFREGHQIRPGQRIEFLAPHCDPTTNLYDRIHCCRGDAIEAVWPLKRLSLNGTIRAS